jgi:hypothetical protein
VAAAEPDHGEVLGQLGRRRIPLRRRQEERQQDQRRTAALDAVGDLGMAALAGEFRRVGRMRGEKFGHRLDQLAGALGRDIGPAMRFVAVEDNSLRTR